MTKEYGLPCPIARTLDIVGDRWTLLIIRDLLNDGAMKYAQLQESLAGIAPNVLSDRLKSLEAHGLVEREFYSDHPPRARYKLTKKGVDLRTTLAALLQWGQRYAYDGVALVHADCGHDVSVAMYCEHCGDRVRPSSVRRKFRRREAAAAARRA